jgi:hypothetical protein
MSITYSECVSVAVVIQHAKRMRHVILSSVICLAAQMFPHYLINDTILGKKVTEHKLRVSIFSTALV